MEVTQILQHDEVSGGLPLLLAVLGIRVLEIVQHEHGF